MAVIGILGAGGVARALARKLTDAGRTVVVGTRDVAKWDVPQARALSLAEAADAGAILVNALPGDVSVDVLGGLSKEIAGKTLVDVANAVVTDAHGFAVALRYPESSLAEELQRALPAARVVKALSTAHVAVMADPGALGDAADVFLSGDDPEAKASVTALLDDLGWPVARIVDLGGVASARGPEGFVLMVGPLVRALGPVPFALAVAR
ncbi:NAD(P)-binding domain-containing protein [Actinocorallia sp. API 0066]|uniref:NADPH-dependent F420 reductase n=1 Tax=Actinocorallia sp. API 0066 TaxID=2896846 RepID=UPI001E3664DC|nr:NAD(P)-binding domain-containing protein [Actinocorallia sp. API 0066]MCD0452179.1 NAD(P)-binding domain-containing protein [Actinocorallia sp. API 0066]